MELTIYAKKRQSKDGRSFFTYLTTLTKKDGSEITSQVKFKDACGAPDGTKCPMNILVEKTDANFREKNITYKDEEGNEKDGIERLLWVSAWTESENPFVDTSMDEFVD